MSDGLPGGTWSLDPDERHALFIVAPMDGPGGRGRFRMVAQVPRMADGARKIAAAIVALPDLIEALEEARHSLDPEDPADELRARIDDVLRRVGRPS